jgi:6-pyruvoyltetrahydropterin/6-carboxytetrahydropterin synthase
MLYDFGKLKSALREIANELDHKVIIPLKGDATISEADREVEISVQEKRYVLPREECIFLPYTTSSAEHIAQYILTVLTKKIQFPPTIRVLKVGVDEGPEQGVWVEEKIG